MGLKIKEHAVIEKGVGDVIDSAASPPLSAKQPDPIATLLLNQAYRHERTMADLRVAALVTFSGLTGAEVISPHLVGFEHYPVAGVLGFFAWTGLAIALAVALHRGWYHPSLRWIIPVLDGAFLLAGALVLTHDAEYAGNLLTRHTGVIATLTALSAALAFSGAFRLSRASVLLTTAAALAVFGTVAAGAGIHSAYTAGTMAVLLLVGVLSLDVADAFRRALRTEVERLHADQRAREAQLAATVAEQSARAREEIPRIVAHDLRNPLNSISVSADVLVEKLPRSGEAAFERKYLQIIQRSAARMNALLGDLLDVARLEAGQLAIEGCAQSIAPVIRESMQIHEPLAAERHLALSADLEPDLPYACLDAARISQALSNLIGNALKFTPAGGKITVRAQRADDRIRVSVADTGTGITADQLPLLFQPFWQARRGDRRGIGLDLAITRGIVEGHGGSIEVRSEPGAGTVFLFTVPIATTPQPSPTRISGSADMPAQTMLSRSDRHSIGIA